MKEAEPNQIRIPENVSITNPSPAFVRLRGSHSSKQEIVAVSRRRDDDQEPVPDDDPPPPPLPISTPDLALQLLICLDANLNNSIVSTVRQAVDPNADVRAACINGTQRIGIWLRPYVNESSNQARDRGLERLNILGAGETMTFFVNSGLIRRQALDGWNAAPKRLNGNGDPDPNGPVHLTGFSVSFEGPNRVVSRIDGFDERPWPDADFRLTTTDTLSAVDDQLSCDTESDLNVDTGWLDFLTGLFLLTLPPLGLVFLAQRLIVGSRDAPDVGAGAGCGALDLIPKEILIPRGEKVVAFYRRVTVATTGIFAGGSVETMPRTPEVTITGPTQISVVEGATSVTRNYTLHTVDLRPPFYEVSSPNFAARITGPAIPRPRIEWSGDGFALRPSGETTGFRFNLADAQAGQVLTHRVAVVVEDVDGLSASTERIVQIHVTPADLDDFPPICKVRPWLPQCKGFMVRASNSRRKET
ncbi:MAG: hypothetical protein LC794_06455 [Acidobacteria bacterium]|nr:hypothetical protein [Acidobacteriota bacterium]